MLTLPATAVQSHGSCLSRNGSEASPRSPALAASLSSVSESGAKRQMEPSATFYYHITDYFVYGLDVFRAKTEWYLGEEQTLLFVNNGPTLHW